MHGSIVVKGVSKRFRRPRGDRLTSFKESVLSGFRRAEMGSFWALRDVSFTVPEGRMVGVVGKNGAGKSTLLRLIGGVGRPSEGTIEVQGRIGALLDLGAGLTDDMTGRENIFIAGVIAGMTRAEVKSCYELIVAFAELESFIEMPIRTYSSGMRMRLAFSVAAHMSPDVLLVDEVLAVGDPRFQRKCIERIASIKARGVTIFLVSHDSSQVRALCDEVLLLDHGRVIAYGPTQAVMDIYEAEETLGEVGDSMLEKTAHLTPTATTSSGRANLQLHVNRFGTLENEILDVELLDLSGRKASRICPGGSLVVQLLVRASIPLDQMHIVVGINNEEGIEIFDVNSAEDVFVLPDKDGLHCVRLLIDRLDLVSGKYFVSAGIYEKSWSFGFDRHVSAYPLTVEGPHREGLIDPPRHWILAHQQHHRSA